MSNERPSTQLISLSKAKFFYPHETSTPSVWRHHRYGVLARNNVRVYLDGVRVGGRIYTTEAAVHKFFQDLAAADREHFVRQEPGHACPANEASGTDVQPTEKMRAQQIERANRQLDRDGLRRGATNG